MALDAQARALLDRIEEAAYPPLHTHPAPVARQIYSQTSALFDAKDVPIGSSEDRTIEGPNGPIPIRILRPVEAAGEPGPAIVFFHGGGFVIGSIESHDVTCRMLANASGYTLVSVDYRLAPEHKFPAGLNDCVTATQWVAEQAADLGVDASRIAVAGDSAGGNLAAVVAQTARDGGGTPPIAYQLLIYPVTDPTRETESRTNFATGYMLEREGIQWFDDCYVNQPEDLHHPGVAPLLAEDFSNLPPAYVVTAGFDPLRDEGAAYAEAMKRAGVDVTYVDYEGMIHGFFNMTGVLDQARAGIEAAAEAMRNKLG